MSIKNKKQAAEHLAYVIETIDRMTTGNLAHHRNAIRSNLKELSAYLNHRAQPTTQHTQAERTEPHR